MKVINGSQGAFVLIDEEEFDRTIPGDIRRMPHHKFTVLYGVVIIEWDTFKSMMEYLDVWYLDDFYKEHGGGGKSITESFWWGSRDKKKVHSESEAKKIILGAVFTELEEQA